MTFGSDTVKQDLGLVIAGAVALLLFFWLYSDFHPLPAADNSFGKVAAEEKSNKLAMELGYESQFEPETEFEVNSDLLDSLQTQTTFKEFYADTINRSLFPAFYWSTVFMMETSDEEDGNFEIGGDESNAIEIQLNEAGEIIAINNQDNILPKSILRPDVLNYAIQGDSIDVYLLLSDSSATNSLEFRFNQSASTRPFRLQRNQINYLGNSIAERIAEHYLSNSGWRAEEFNIVSVERVPIGEDEGALVRFEKTVPDLRQTIQLEVKILPTGALVAMEYNHPNLYESDNMFSTIKIGIRAIVYLVGGFWIIVLLFIRFRLRLIDIKAATLVAVLAGLIFPMVVSLQMVHEQLVLYGTISFQFVMLQLVLIGVTAAISTLGFFTVTAISDSITRQYWIEKLRTIDVLRVGYFNNIPVGLTLIRGISYGFILAFAWCLVLYLIPDSFISVETNFKADTTYFPYFTELLGNFVYYFIVTQAIFLIFVGQLRGSFKSAAAAIAVPTLLFIVVYPFPFEVGGLTTELLVGALAGFGLSLIYYREDFLTTFVSIFIFVSVITTADGWLIDNSPDASIFYTLVVLIIVGFVAGGYTIYRGRSVRDLPKFVPEYIEELAQQDRIRQELRIARKVQQSFLPISTPNIEGYDFAAICKPAYETGGDYYDFISLNDHHLAVTIGDVSGKGIQAAFYMTFTKGVLHALCSDFRSTIDILAKTNTMFRNNSNRGTFISLIFGILDLKENCFRFSRAGHNPVLYYKKSENKLYEYQPEGIAIGMADEERFRKNISEKNIELETEDILILFTDGVVESISKTNKLYGDQRLQNVIKENYELSAGKLIKKIEEDLDTFGEKSAQHDDLTMIVIKKK